MHCPYCRHTDTRVLDSRVAEDGGAIRRRRSCNECGKRFSTVEQMQLVVVKRLVLKERIKIRRRRTPEVRLFEQTLRRERLEVDDPSGIGAVHERYPGNGREHTGFLESVAHKILG